MAPIRVTVPSSTAGSSTSCWAFDHRWTSSTNSTVRKRPPFAPSITLRASATPEETAESCDQVGADGVGQQVRERGLARPGRTPQDDRGQVAASISFVSAVPGPTRCVCPTNSSNVRGRIRAASGWSAHAGRPATSTEDAVGADPSRTRTWPTTGPALAVVSLRRSMCSATPSVSIVDDGAADRDRACADRPERGPETDTRGSRRMLRSFFAPTALFTSDMPSSSRRSTAAPRAASRPRSSWRGARGSVGPQDCELLGRELGHRSSVCSVGSFGGSTRRSAELAELVLVDRGRARR